MTTGFTDQIRELPDERLAALLRLRPDLVVPVPADLSALALRAQSRVSVARALDPLDRFTLEILDALRLTQAEHGATSADPPIGTTTAAATADPDSPVGWLVASHLLVPITDSTVELPREIGALLRRE